MHRKPGLAIQGPDVETIICVIGFMWFFAVLVAVLVAVTTPSTPIAEPAAQQSSRLDQPPSNAHPRGTGKR